MEGSDDDMEHDGDGVRILKNFQPLRDSDGAQLSGDEDIQEDSDDFDDNASFASVDDLEGVILRLAILLGADRLLASR